MGYCLKKILWKYDILLYLAQKNTLLLTVWSPTKPICSQLKVTTALLSMRLIFGELKDNHNGSYCIKGW